MDMEPNELTIQYGVELTGEAHDHEEFRTMVEEMGGEIVVEKDKAGYFEAMEDESDE